MTRKPSLFMRQFLTALISLVAGIALAPKVAYGQIVPDETLGEESSTVRQDVIKDVDSDIIEGGAIRGGNLFHSFEEFNVEAGRGAYFANPDAIANILSRVTGSNISEIMGTLGVLGDANLFLINPNGIVFGENARLDLNGSFFASTADSLLFDNGFEFSGSNPEAPPLLTVNIPVGLGFRDNPGSIENQSVSEDVGLQVPTGETLALIGGDVSFEGGKITAPGARVELGGLVEVGTVDISENGGLTFPNGVTRADVSLSESALVDVTNRGGGFINVNARNLALLGGSELVVGIAAGLDGTDSPAGDINLNATEAINVSQGSSVQNLVNGVATGNSGDIKVQAGSFNLTEGGFFIASTFGKGNAGDVKLEVEGVVELVNANIFSTVEAGGVGDGGNITINGQSLSLTDDAQLQTLVRGAKKTTPAGKGNAGNINIQVGLLSLNGETNKIISSTFGQGDAGDITIEVEGAVELVGGEISSNVESRAEGNGGEIDITANQLSLTKKAKLNTSTSGQGDAGNVTIEAEGAVELVGGEISSNVGNFGAIFSGLGNEAKGNAGDISITADSLTLEEGGFLSNSTSGKGNAGDIIINAADIIFFDNASNAQSRVEETATGNGGNINIQARTLSLANGSEILADTFGKGKAGKIKVNASDSVILSGVAPYPVLEDGSAGGFSSGLIAATEKNAKRQGGDISVTTDRLQISDGAVLTARSRSDLRGGDIEVNANVLEVTGGGQILTTAFSNGNAGKINLNISDRIFLSGSDPTFFDRLNQLTAESSPEEAEFTIDPVSPESGIFADTKSDSRGNGGSIKLSADNLSLNNSAEISAATASGTGGNIDLAIADTLLLENNSTITAKAESDGNGGNININADFTILKESDIIANAFKGAGGNINITTQELFQRNSKIDASSEFGLDGVVRLNTPEIDPSQGVIELPVNVQDPNKLIAQDACKLGKESSLVVTGRGGLPPSSSQDFNSNWVDVDLIKPIFPEEQSPLESNQEANVVSSPDAASQNQLIPAEGWVVNEKGEVFLVAYKSGNANSQRQHHRNYCQPK